MFIKCICLNLRQMSSKNYAIFWRGGGRSLKDHIGSQGGRGEVKTGQQKDHIIFNAPLFRKSF